MGVVYRAHRRQLGDAVAIKVLKPRFASRSDLIHRFLKEARTTALLKHNKNILQIYTLNEGGEKVLPYFAMEFLTGQSLRDLLLDKSAKKRTRLELNRALVLMDEICVGVGAAHRHEKKIVHRDLKPDNIWVLPFNPEEDDKESIKVLDFGIVKAREENEASSWKTDPLSIMGTYPYMSPEQCRGSEVDVRSDIYSLGVMLYEMLAGRTPFISKNPQGYIAQHLNDPSPPLPEDLNIPHEIEDVIMKALAKDPAERPADALALRRSLRDAQRTAERRMQEEQQEEEQWKQRDTVIRELERRKREREEKERLAIRVKLRQEAQQASKSENWEKAVEMLQALLDISPTSEEVRQELKAAQQNLHLRHIYAEAEEHHKAGQFLEALKLLQRIQRKDESYKDVNNAIRDIEDKIKEQKVTTLYRYAQVAIAEEEWATAIEQLQALLKIDADNSDAINQLNHAQLQLRLTQLYVDGSEQYRTEQWPKALEIFHEILRLGGDYKATAGFIEQIQVRTRQKQIETLYSEAQKAITAEKWNAAIEPLQAVLKLDPAQSEAKTKLAFVQQRQQLMTTYSAGLKHYEAGRWQEALDLFVQVEGIAPNYKEISKLIKESQNKVDRERVNALLSDAQAAIDKESWATAIELLQELLKLDSANIDAKAKLSHVIQRKNLANFYATGVAHLQGGRLPQALTDFQLVQEIDKSYKDINRRIEETQHKLRQKNEELQRNLRQKRIDDKLAEAKRLIADGAWSDAFGAVNEILSLEPNHRVAVAKLNEIVRKQRDAELAVQQQGKKREEQERRRKEAAKKRLRRLLAGSLAILLLAGIATFVYYRPTSSADSPPTEGQRQIAIRPLNDSWQPIDRKLSDKGDTPIGFVGLSPDGDRLVSNSITRATLWYLKGTLRQIPLIPPHGENIFAMAFSPDGQLIATAFGDGTVQLWEAKGGNPGKPLKINDAGSSKPAQALAFSADSKYLAAGYNDGIAVMWNVESYSKTTLQADSQGRGKEIASIEFSPTKNLLAAGAADGTVMIWNLENKDARPNTIQAHNKSITKIAFSPDGKTLASSSDDKTVLLWDINNDNLESRARLSHNEVVISMAFSADSTILATGTRGPKNLGGTVNLWDLSNEVKASPWKTQRIDRDVTSVAYSANGKLLAIGEGNGELLTWDVSDMKQ